MVRFLESVRFVRTSPALFHILEVLAVDADSHLVTAGTDGGHVEGSAHYRGEALDLRSRDLPDLQAKRAMQRHLRTIVGPQFVVLLEPWDLPDCHNPEHFHLQLEHGQTYP